MLRLSALEQYPPKSALVMMVMRTLSSFSERWHISTVWSNFFILTVDI